MATLLKLSQFKNGSPSVGFDRSGNSDPNSFHVIEFDELEQNGEEVPMNTVALVCAAKLRKLVYISIGCSWERTSTDIANWFKTIQGDSYCMAYRHVVVTFGLAGALYWHRPNSTSAPVLYLIYDPKNQEGDLKPVNPTRSRNKIRPVAPVFRADTLTAELTEQEKKNLHDSKKVRISIKNTLEKWRQKFDNQIFGKEKQRGRFVYAEIKVPISNQLGKNIPPEWTILDQLISEKYEGAAAKELATKLGAAIFKNWEATSPTGMLEFIPLQEYGDLLTRNRTEIESYRAIRSLLFEYTSNPSIQKPLSFAVFGPPGSGKSFGVKQIAGGLTGSKNSAVYTFNLSQFNSQDDLNRAFHLIRDACIKNKIPLVFFDEFDSNLAGQHLGWLKYFLAPMQDGEFFEQGTPHSIGRAIFVFAGGTCTNYEDFSGHATQEGQAAFRACKGPDFVSRLRGYINISGIDHPMPNRSSAVFLTRAHILNTQISKIIHKEKQDNDAEDKENREKISEQLLQAFLLIPQYRHGVRSMEAIVEMSKLAGKEIYDSSCLPDRDQLNLHVDAEEFLQLAMSPSDTTLSSYDLEKLQEAQLRSCKCDESGSTSAYRDAARSQFDAAILRIPEKLKIGKLKLRRAERPAIRYIPERSVIEIAKQEHSMHRAQLLKTGAQSVADEFALANWGDPRFQDMQKRAMEDIRRIPEWLAYAGFEVIGLIPKSNLPNIRQNSIVDRRILRDIDDCLLNQGRRIVCVTGEKGIGKTTVLGRWSFEWAAVGFRGAKYFDWSFWNGSFGDFLKAATAHFSPDTGETAFLECPNRELLTTLSQILADQRYLFALHGLEQFAMDCVDGDYSTLELISFLEMIKSHSGGLCILSCDSDESKKGVISRIMLGVGAASIDIVKYSQNESTVWNQELFKKHLGECALAKPDALIPTIKAFFETYVATLPDPNKTILNKELWLPLSDTAAEGTKTVEFLSFFEKLLEYEGESGRCKKIVFLALALLTGAVEKAQVPEIVSKIATAAGVPEADLSSVVGEKGISDAVNALLSMKLLETVGNKSIKCHPVFSKALENALRKNERLWQRCNFEFFIYFDQQQIELPTNQEEDKLRLSCFAVKHSFRSGRVNEAVKYFKKYVSKNGATFNTFGARYIDFNTLTIFFEENESAPPKTHRWDSLYPGVQRDDVHWLYNAIGNRLMQMGRIIEAENPIRKGWEAAARFAEKKTSDGDGGATQILGNYLLLLHVKGDVNKGIREAKTWLDMCKNYKLEHDYHLTLTKAYLASLKFYAGDDKGVEEAFAEAEKINQGALRGTISYLRCNHLLYKMEHDAWSIMLGKKVDFDHKDLAARCEQIGEMTVQINDGEQKSVAEATMAKKAKKPPTKLTRALMHVVKARESLCMKILGSDRTITSILDEVDKSMFLFSEVGADHLKPLAQLTRAWALHCAKANSDSDAELKEVELFARYHGIGPYLADAYLYRARLFRDKDSLRMAEFKLKELGNEGYRRRDAELNDARISFGHASDNNEALAKRI